jgi:uncharacterized protein (DUF2252 family)
MILQRIQAFNQGREPELLALKYRLMRESNFSFFRGTCHLFYEDWPAQTILNEAPPVWVCGDLHLENFGTYKGINRLTYFDLNDFDESALAPCTWDLARFLTSILVATNFLGINKADALTLCHIFLAAYTQALAAGKAHTVERDSTTGMIADLLVRLKKRKRKDFLDERTSLIKNQRKLRFDNHRTQPVPESVRVKITKFIENWGSQQLDPTFFQLLDVGRRIAGTSSLGLERYILLVRGKSSPDQNYLLDLKAVKSSSLYPYLTLVQPQWMSQAERVVTVERRVQGTVPALLTAIEFEGNSYVLRELQPTQDRLNLTQWQGNLRRLEKVIKTMGELTAWSQQRSSGRQGSAVSDQLSVFAQQKQWQASLVAYAQEYSLQVEADYRDFCNQLI